MKYGLFDYATIGVAILDDFSKDAIRVFDNKGEAEEARLEYIEAYALTKREAADVVVKEMK